MDSQEMKQYLDISPEVAEALANNKPVVALESTIISHGMPWPQNAETAKKVEQIIRDNGAVPATIAILDGRLKAGLSHEEIDTLGQAGLSVIKCSRRDLPFVVATKQHGATTVAATMIVAKSLRQAVLVAFTEALKPVLIFLLTCKNLLKPMLLLSALARNLFLTLALPVST